VSLVNRPALCRRSLTRGGFGSVSDPVRSLIELVQLPSQEGNRDHFRRRHVVDRWSARQDRPCRGSHGWEGRALVHPLVFGVGPVQDYARGLRGEHQGLAGDAMWVGEHVLHPVVEVPAVVPGGDDHDVHHWKHDVRQPDPLRGQRTVAWRVRPAEPADRAGGELLTREQVQVDRVVLRRGGVEPIDDVDVEPSVGVLVRVVAAVRDEIQGDLGEEGVGVRHVPRGRGPEALREDP
jgi:hypothetical protein